MAVRRVQLRRGNTAENDAFTGAVGELTVDTQTVSVRVHDGTAGGKDLMRADMSNDSFADGDITIAEGVGNNTLTIGAAGTTVAIAGNLTVAGTTTQANALTVDAKLITVNANGNGAPEDLDSIGIIFERYNDGNPGAQQDNAFMIWREDGDYFVLGTANVTENTASDFVNVGGIDFAYTDLYLGTLYAQSGVDLNDQNITNVGDIALDTISADGNTISMTLKQAGAGTAFTIVDDNQAGTGVATFLTINATDGADDLEISAKTFTVVSASGSTFNNSNSGTGDFTVKGQTDNALIFVDASTDRVGISEPVPQTTFHVSGSTTLDGAVSLNTSRADVDFNVASSNAVNVPNALFVQGSDGYVGVNNGAPAFNLDVTGTSAFSGIARFSGDVDLRTQDGPNNGITFNKGIANDTTDANLLRVDRSGNSFSALTWNATTSRFVWDTNLQISSGELILGDGTNVTKISVPDQTEGANTLGEHLELSAGKGKGTEGGGSIILKTGGDNAAAPDATLTLNKDKLAQFAGSIQVDGNTIAQSTGATVITFSGDGNLTSTFSGPVVSNSTATFSGGSITLGQANGAGTSISVPTTDQGGAGWDLTISSGVGADAGNNDGSLYLRSGTANVVKLDSAEKATFYGNIDFSANEARTIGATIGAGTTLTLGGNATSIIATAGDLKVTGNTIKSSTADAIELSGANVDVLGTLEVSGNIIKNAQSVNAISFSNDADANVTLFNNLTINGTDISSEAAADILTLFTSNTGGISLGSTGTITLGATAGLVKVSTLQLIDDSIKSSNDAGTSLSFAANGSLVTVGGDLKVGGNDIQNSGNSNAISFSADNTTTRISASTKTILTGGLEVEGESIESSTAEAITLSGANVTTVGDLTVTGADINLGANVNGTNTSIAPLKRTGADLAGNDLYIRGGKSTGDKAGGRILLQTSPSGVAGAGENAHATALIIASDRTATFQHNVVITGDLEVNGTTTQIDSTISTYVDPIIHLNKDGLENSDLGVYMSVHANDNNHQNLAMYWDDAEGSFAFASTSADLGDTQGAVNLSAGAGFRYEPVIARSLTLDGKDTAGTTLQVGDSSGTAAAFIVNKTGALTSKNTASFDIDSETALVVSKNAGVNVALRIDTTNLDVETSDLVSLQHNTYNVGTDANRYATGYFGDLQTTSLTATGALTLSGAVTYSNVSPISITTAGTNGITFRSEIADQGADANATLLRVNIGGAGPTYQSIKWVAASDEFSVESGLNSVGDFGVGTVGAETFVVTASTGDVKIEGDITTDSDEDKNIFAGVTTATKLITLGGGGTVVTGANLRVGGNIIQNAEGETTITLDNDQNVNVQGALKVTGDSIESSTAEAITLDGANVTTVGDLTVTGADIYLGANVNGTNTSIAPLKRTGADLAGNNLYIQGGKSTGDQAGGKILLQTSPSGVAGAGENTSRSVLELQSDLLARFYGDIQLGGTDISSDAAGDVLTLFTANTGGITLGKDQVTLGDATGTAIMANTLQVNGNITSANVAKSIFTAVTNTITIGGAGAVELGGTLKIAGQTISGRADNDLIIKSDTDLIFRVDADNDGANTFQFKNGADATVAELDESGNLTLSASLKSETDLVLHIDSNNDGANRFSFVHGAGAGTEVASLTESGNLTLSGTLTANGGDATIKAVSGGDANLYIVADASEDNGDEWRIQAPNATRTISFGNENTAGNAYVDVLTLTGDDTATSTLATFAGSVRVNGGVIQNSDGETTISFDANQNVTLAGNLDVTGVITGNSAVAGSLRFKDPTLYLGYQNTASTRDLGFVGAYGDTNFNDYLMGVVYEVDDTAGGKAGAFKIFHGRADVSEPNLTYSVPDSELAPVEVGGLTVKNGGGVTITKTTGLTGDEGASNAPLFTTDKRAFQATITTDTAIADDAHSIGFVVNNTSVSSTSVIMATVSAAEDNLAADIMAEGGIEVYAHTITDATSFEFSLVNRTGAQINADSAITINFVIL